ncbi:MAG: hypothetical protein RL150_436 [Candidatus Parcubacteria bacterium]|jgi:hypothetical protein
MSELGIEFEEEYNGSDFHIRSRKLLGEKTTPTMITFLIDRGVAKSEKQAFIISIALIVIFISLSVFIIRVSLVNNEPIKVIDKYGRSIPFDDYVQQLNEKPL